MYRIDDYGNTKKHNPFDYSKANYPMKEAEALGIKEIYFAMLKDGYTQVDFNKAQGVLHDRTPTLKATDDYLVLTSGEGVEVIRFFANMTDQDGDNCWLCMDKTGDYHIIYHDDDTGEYYAWD